MPDKREILAKITDNPRLPSPPTIALQVIEKANSPRCTIGEIAKIISLDPSLCGKLFKVLNSSLFALPRAITSITHALNMLGIKRVRSLVLGLSLPAMQVNSRGEPHMRNHWKMSIVSGIIARDLAGRRNSLDSDSEMVFALLSDLGVLILQEVYPEDYARVAAHSLEEIVNGQCAVEEAIFGVNHAEVSASILTRWRMPDEVTQAILYHHEPELAPACFQERAHLLHFAQRGAQLQLSTGTEVNVAEILTIAGERFGMNDTAFRDFLEPVTSKTLEFARLMNIEVGECRQFSTLLSSATENLTRLAFETTADSLRSEMAKDQAEQELQKTEKVLVQTEEKLRHALKLEAIGRLAGGVAHDFNNLLTIINGYSELMISMVPAGNPMRAMIDEVHQAGSRAADLTRQLLAFSRKQLLTPVVLDINDAVGNVEKMLRRLVGENIQLTTKLDPSVSLVRVDHGQLDQIFVNLIVNARDAMPDGGRIEIETANVVLDASVLLAEVDVTPGPFVRLVIRDTGTGMSDPVKAKIFEPFFTTKESRGTGLGLATVHGIVKQSGGHIAVASEIGRGTSFSIYLPIASADATVDQQGPASVSLTRGSETVLIAEDEDHVRDIVRRMVESFGYSTLEARDGREALEVSRGHDGPIHLLLTDVVMPRMSGADLAQQLKRLRPNVKVLFCSGYTDESVLRHGVTAATLLQKPFSAERLASRIREALQSA